MKLNEIHAEGQEPLLFVLMKQRMDKGDRIARYYRAGDSVKPMWVVDWHYNKDDDHWVIRVNKGNNIAYVTYATADLDKLELVPGKTKKTWQLRKMAQLKEGRGEELMSYTDFAEKAYTKAKTRAMYDTLAAELFKRGFSFSISPKGTAGRFKKEINGEGIQLSITGNSAPTHSSRRTVIVSITGHDPGTGEPRGKHESYEIDDLVDNGADLDFVLQGGSA